MEQTEKSSAVKASTKCRWWQFGLRTMFVWMTAIGVLLTVALQWITPAQQQMAAVRMVERVGGYIGYSEPFEDEAFIDPSEDEDWLTRRLRDWLPRDYFDTVRYISLNGCAVTDADLASLATLTTLESLELDGTQVTDAGLSHLKGLTHLATLDLRKTQVTSAGLAHLSGLTQLRTLNLNFSQVSDDGLVHLHRLTELKTLLLDNTQVTGMGIPPLRQAIPNCHILYSRAE